MKLLSNKSLLASSFLIITAFFCIFSFKCNANTQKNDAQHAYDKHILNKNLNSKTDDFFSLVPLYNKFLEPKTKILDFEGKSIQLSDFRNKFVVLFFWATWCNNCFDILNKLEKFKNELDYRNVKDVVILPISVDFKKPNKVLEILEANKISVETYFDSKKMLMANFNVKNLPATFFINKSGEVIYEFSAQEADWSSNLFIQKFIELKNSNELNETDVVNVNDSNNLIHGKQLNNNSIIFKGDNKNTVIIQ